MELMGFMLSELCDTCRHHALVAGGGSESGYYTKVLEDRIRQVFDRIDKNENGTLSRGEIRTYLFDLCTNNKFERNAWAQEIISVYDHDDDEQIDFFEFRRMITLSLTGTSRLVAIAYMERLLRARCVHENGSHRRTK